MQLKYERSESTVKPLIVEIAKHTIFIRKDIREETRSYGDNTYIMYVYDEAKLTHEEFNQYSKCLAVSSAIDGEKDSANILQLISGQENGDNNQLIIMEAIADLYDAIASMM